MSEDHDNDDFATQPAEPKTTSPEPRPGYKIPPHKHRFKKGVSGNPRGRPKGARGNRKIAEKVLLEQHEVVEAGEIHMRTTLELVLLSLCQLAYKGNTRSAKTLQAIEDKYDPPEPDRKAGLLVVPGRLTQEAWNELYAPKDPPMS